MTVKAWDVYTRRINLNGSTQKDRFITNTQRIITDKFSNNPSYYIVTVNDVSQGVQIVDENSLYKNPNKKRILCKPGEDIQVGDLVVWESEYWLCTSRDDIDVYVRGIIEKCNNTLNWRNDVGTVISKYCIVKNNSGGIEVNKYLILGDGKINVILASDSDSDELEEDMRFIINNRFAFKIIQIDDYTNDGVLSIIMSECEVDNENDDLVNNIAYNPSNVHTYSIVILNGASVELNVGTNLQLEVECTDNGSVVTGATASFSLTTGTGIISVSTAGLVTPIIVGTGANVVVVYNSASDDIDFDVIATAVSNFSYALVGNIQPDNEIKFNQTKIYSAYKYYSTGTVVTGSVFDFSIALSTSASSNNYLLTTSSDTSVTLKCLQYPYNISLVAVDQADITQSITQVISLKGLI